MKWFSSLWTSQPPKHRTIIHVFLIPFEIVKKITSKHTLAHLCLLISASRFSHKPRWFHTIRHASCSLSNYDSKLLWHLFCFQPHNFASMHCGTSPCWIVLRFVFILISSWHPTIKNDTHTWRNTYVTNYILYHSTMNIDYPWLSTFTGSLDNFIARAGPTDKGRTNSGRLPRHTSIETIACWKLSKRDILQALWRAWDFARKISQPVTCPAQWRGQMETTLRH